MRAAQVPVSPAVKAGDVESDRVTATTTTNTTSTTTAKVKQQQQQQRQRQPQLLETQHHLQQSLNNYDNKPCNDHADDASVASSVEGSLNDEVRWRRGTCRLGGRGVVANFFGVEGA